MKKHIIIKNCTEKELRTILNDWLIMNVDGLKSNMIFEFSEIKPTTFILKVDDRIDDITFFYMVNYFAYPIDFDRTFDVEGFATATKYKKLLNKNMFIFIKEYDSVWITTEDNETYKFDFKEKLSKVSSEIEYKKLDIYDLPATYQQINISKKDLIEEAKKAEEQRKRDRLEERFKIISTALFILIPLILLVNRYFPYFSNEKLVFICSIAISIWFIADNEIFKNTKRAFTCLLLALLVIIFGVDTATASTATTASIPLSAVIILWAIIKFSKIKLDYVYDSKWGGLFVFLIFIVSFLISEFIFNPILLSL